VRSRASEGTPRRLASVVRNERLSKWSQSNGAGLVRGGTPGAVGGEPGRGVVAGKPVVLGGGARCRRLEGGARGGGVESGGVGEVASCGAYGLSGEGGSAGWFSGAGRGPSRAIKSAWVTFGGGLWLMALCASKSSAAQDLATRAAEQRRRHNCAGSGSITHLCPPARSRRLCKTTGDFTDRPE
jgi:hypothetical protein